MPDKNMRSMKNKATNENNEPYLLNLLLSDMLLLDLAFKVFILKQPLRAELIARNMSRQQRVFYVNELTHLQGMDGLEDAINTAYRVNAKKMLK